MCAAMATLDASDHDTRDWSALRYAPREQRAPNGARYAPWWQRVTAFLIDISAVLTAVLTVATPILVLAGFRDGDAASDSAKTWLSILLLTATLVLGAVYAIVLEGRSGQTWGK